MSDQPQERFNLPDFVLGYLEEAGSVIMPPEFGIYEVLMPDELADALAFDDYARIAFTASASAPNQTPTNGIADDDTIRLGVNHPLVENIAETLTTQPANIRTYIRGVRTDKRGLADLAHKHFGLPNARVSELPKTTEVATQHHYLLCNFKVTLLSEEKQEDLMTVVMDVQAGHAVESDELLQQLMLLDTKPAFEGLPVAAPRWQGAADALAAETLQRLLPRAEAALRDRLADQAASLAARMERHLALDLARIGDYYDEMRADLLKRQGRLAADDARRQDFDDKLAMLSAERTTKLDDARGRYQLRVDMKLVNVVLATQAKVTLPMTISNRTAQITRTVVWDPLLHRLEPLVCDVCGKPGEGLHLCTGGHMTHESCLAPQCIDCKREFCQLCATQLAECVVCHQPVCRPSLIQCSTCARGTCNEHQQLCHAADGEPAVLPTSTTPIDEAIAPAATPAAAAQAAPKPPMSHGSRQRGKTSLQSKTRDSSSRAARKPPKTKTPPRPPTAKGVRIDVQVDEHEPRIVASVMKSTKRVLATRSFELTPQGILVHCQCEKSPCPVHGYYHRPMPAATIAEQIGAQIQKLQQEYRIPAKKVQYFYKRYSQVHEERRLILPEVWRDPARLAEATRGFAALA